MGLGTLGQTEASMIPVIALLSLGIELACFCHCPVWPRVLGEYLYRLWAGYSFTEGLIGRARAHPGLGG